MDNALLLRQLVKHIGKDWEQVVPADCIPLLEAVARTYQHHKRDRELLERAIDISSSELTEANSRLHDDAEKQRILIHKLKESIIALQLDSSLLNVEEVEDDDLLSIAEHLMFQIRQRQQAEKQLVESRARLSALINSTADIIWSVNTDLALTSCNATFRRIFLSDTNYSQLFDLPFEVYMPQSEHRYWQQLYQRALQGEHFTQDFERTIAGEEIYYELSFTPIVIQGKTTGISILGHDITERKQAEIIIRKRDRLLQGLAQAMQYLLSINIDKALPRALEALGISAQVEQVLLFENIPDPFTGALVAERRVFWCKDEQYTQQEAAQSFSYIELLPYSFASLADGIPVLIHTDRANAPEHALPFAHNLRSILLAPIMVEEYFWGVLCFTHCDTERVWHDHDESILTAAASSIGGAIVYDRSRKALEQSEERYRSVISSVKEVIFQADMYMNFHFLNPAWEELTGYSLDRSLETCFADYAPSTMQEPMEAFCSTLREKDRDMYRQEVAICASNGRILWVDIYASILTDEYGKRRSVSGTISDITERKRAEQELENALRKERDLNLLKTRFVGTVSHEFRTPLSGILMSTELLENYFERMNAQQRRDEITKIRERVNELTILMDDVLDHSSVESIVELFKPRPLEVQKLCQLVIEDVSSLAKKTEHNINFHSNSNTGILYADLKLLRYVLRNLLSNALKYSPKTASVDFTVQQHEQHIVFQVSDKGIGIPADDLPRLFTPFFRASNTGSIKGTGLGLSIVKELVEAHKGTIEVESKTGVGTTFTVFIPTTPIEGLETDEQQALSPTP